MTIIFIMLDIKNYIKMQRLYLYYKQYQYVTNLAQLSLYVEIPTHRRTTCSKHTIRHNTLSIGTVT